MARLTVADMIDAVTDFIPSIAQAKIVRASNYVLQRIHVETSIPEYSTVTTKAKVTTGTVSVAQDSTTATFSSAVLSTSDPFHLVQIEGDSAWFPLTPSSTTVGALASKWAVATDADATYTLVYPSISFPRGVHQVTRIWRESLGDIVYAADRGSDFQAFTGSITGTPTTWSPYAHDSASASPDDDLLRILLTPAPESREVLMYSFVRRPTLLTPGGATSQAYPVPEFWTPTLVAGTLFWLWDQRDKQDRSAYWLSEYNREFSRVRGTLNQSAVVRGRAMTRTLTTFPAQPTQG